MFISLRLDVESVSLTVYFNLNEEQLTLYETSSKHSNIYTIKSTFLYDFFLILLCSQANPSTRQIYKTMWFSFIQVSRIAKKYPITLKMIPWNRTPSVINFPYDEVSKYINGGKKPKQGIGEEEKSIFRLNLKK